MSPTQPSPALSPHEAQGRLRSALHGNALVVDLETTGLDPLRDRIIEIAAVRLRNGHLAEHWSTLVNPGRAIPREVSDLTGFTDSTVAGAPTFGEVLGGLREISTGAAVLIGHHVEFDATFLSAETARLAQRDPHLPLLEAPRLCTAAAARALVPREALGRYTLGNLAAHFAIPHDNPHRASSDALATARLLLALSACSIPAPRR